MNKYIIIVIVLVLIIGAGAVYRTYFLPEIDKPIVTGVEREVSIITFENTWRFVPEFLEIEQGDKVTITVTNHDEYDHGFAIDAFGVSQRMPAKETIQIEFIATKAGDFPFYCSVSCGSGVVDGETRGHFDHIGKMHVASIISETSDFGGNEATLTDEEIKAEARKAGILSVATQEAERLGFSLDDLRISIDEDKKSWNAHIGDTPPTVHEQTLEKLGERESHIVYFTNKADDKFILWLFIDATSGEIIAHEE